MRKILIAALSLFSTVGWSTALMLSTNATNNTQTAYESPAAIHHVATRSSAWTPKSTNLSKNNNRTVPLALKTKSSTPKVLGDTTYNTDQITSDQALDLDKPGIIAIINHLGGSIDVPDFDVDLNTFTLTPRPDLPAHTTTINEDLYGSGFIVSPNGYAITNAHVISKYDTVVQLKKDISAHVSDVYKFELGNLSNKDYSSYNTSLNKLYGAAGASSDQKIQTAVDAAINNYIKANAKDNTTQQIIVVNKSLSPDSLPKDNPVQTIFNNGLPVTIIGFDPYYQSSGADVALIKIPGSNLPSLPLGDTTGITSGSSVVVLGYPHNAQISSIDLFQPTLTQGIISSVKQLNSQTVYQLDNKTSEGSSGSAVTDTHGRVIGIITYINGDPSTGDQFTYALPIDLAKNILNQYQVSNDIGIYGTNFLLGLSLENKTSCKKAIDAFNAAGQADSRFTPQNYLSRYIQSCQNLIDGGKSKDTALDTVRIFYQNSAENAAIFSALAATLLFFLGWMLFNLIKHLGKNKNMVPVPTPQMNLN